MRKILALALLLTTPAIACDPDEVDRAMTEVCVATIQAAEEAVQAALPLARGGEAATLDTELARLRALCAQGDPAVAAGEAARLARAAGRIEARGDAPRPASL